MALAPPVVGFTNFRPERAEFMNLAKLFLAAAVFVGGVYAWHVHQRSVIDRELSASADSNGFVPVIMPDGAPPGTVLVFGTLDLPAAEAQRADAMAKQLNEMGIPTKRTNHYTAANITQEQQSLVAHTEALLHGEIPIVLLNGVAKANPTVDEVAAEYRRDK
jgi:hypothetical protein